MSVSNHGRAANEVSVDEARAPRTQWQALQYLKELGLAVNPNVALCKSIDDVIAYCEKWESKRDELDYEIDGVVIKVDDLRVQEKLGAAGRDPRWAIAYKFKPREARTKLLDIVITVGRTGTLNPNAVLEPVAIGGVTVRNATLHNAEYIRSNDIRAGDTVLVTRAGDVIPRVVGPILSERKGNPRRFVMPDRARSAVRTSTILKARRCRAALTRLVRRRCSSACGTFARAARWISRASAT